MELAIDAVRQSGKIAEAAICYTGDLNDPTRSKYNIDYYKIWRWNWNKPVPIF